MERKATEILRSVGRSKSRAIGISSKTKFVFPWNQLGLFAMQQLRKGQFVELNSILDLVFFQSRALSSLFEKAVPGGAQFIGSNGRLNKYFPFIRCKSKRQIGSLIVAGQNSIKPSIGLIGANGMQGWGGSVHNHHRLPDLY